MEPAAQVTQSYIKVPYKVVMPITQYKKVPYKVVMLITQYKKKDIFYSRVEYIALYLEN